MQEHRPDRMSRRDALKAAIALVGGTAVAGSIPSLAFASDAAPRYLDTKLFAVLTHSVDIIIPATDTPGAVDAGVHVLIDGLLADVASPDRREAFTTVLERVDAKAQEMYGAGLAALDAGQRFEVVRRCDELAYGDVEEDQGFRKLKQVTLLGYYTSEIGASVELRFDPVPGPFQGCVPLEDVGRALYKHGR